MTDIATLGVVLAVVSLFRSRLAGWPVTAPMLFVAAGLALGPDALGVLTIELEDESLALAAEITLAMLLFSDAARIDTATLRRSLNLPFRLLGIGLPFSVAIGTVVTAMLLTDLRWSEAALIAAILAPTDAALGQAVVSNEAVPVRIRQALNVESGLNDGLIVPAVALFSVLAAGDELEGTSALIGDAVTEVAVGVVLGAAVGLALGLVTRWGITKRWTDNEGLRLLTLGGGLGGFGAAGVLGGNGFITAFVAGIALHLVLGEQAGERTSLAEDVGQVGASAMFVIFGALMVWPALQHLTWQVAICCLATLTIGRMIPVRLATIGAQLKAPTVLFLGWFGPRGLASLLFGVILVAERGAEVDQLFLIITTVILASVMLHGISAVPGARRYSQWFADHGRPEMAESAEVPASRIRWTR